MDVPDKDQTPDETRPPFSHEVPRMAQTHSPTDLSTIPADLVRATAFNAARDAEYAAHLLDLLAQTPAGRWFAEKPVLLPAAFLLRLGAAIRLLMWEQNSICIHLAAGLPPAREALRDVFHAPIDPEAASRIEDLPKRVFCLSVEHFAWAGRIELAADVTLDPVDEQMALEALADFLWNHRHLGQPQRRD
jgi:hypothetical protein